MEWWKIGKLNNLPIINMSVPGYSTYEGPMHLWLPQKIKNSFSKFICEKLTQRKTSQYMHISRNYTSNFSRSHTDNDTTRATELDWFSRWWRNRNLSNMLVQFLIPTPNSKMKTHYYARTWTVLNQAYGDLWT
jgi:hypothetical protein